MGSILEPAPVKLFAGVLTSLPELLPALEQRLTDLFGPIDLGGERFPFDSTDYYEREMGAPLVRVFYGFERLASSSALAEAKRSTNDLEAEFACSSDRAARPVNVDPGYLEMAKIVLASTKNFYHRIHLSGGIYGETTLHFERGRWERFPWTFPDFRTGRYDPFFTELRERYRGQLKAAGR